MRKQKEKRYQGIGAIDEAFENENTRSDSKCCSYLEKWKAICQAIARSILVTQGAFSDNDAPDIDGFINELFLCSSCKNYFCRWFQINDKMITKYKWFQRNERSYVYIVFVS